MPNRTGLFAVIVTGSRNWTDPEPIRARLRKYPTVRTVVIHGDYYGADTVADEVANELGMTVVPMPAQWGEYGLGAGMKRNEAMARVAAALEECGYRVFIEAFPLAKSVGTWGMVRIGEKRGWRVETWRAAA